MKVLLLNGSPHAKGCTFTALSEVAKELETQGIQMEILQIGTQPVRGCIGCRRCRTTGHCIFDDGIVNLVIDKAAEADGFIVGSPVYYASANGALIALLDRIFYAGSKNFVYKPAAAVVSARRAGTTASFDELNKYFTISQMPVVSSQYWNMVHGNTPDEVRQDLEGMQIMRTLGRNMAWLLQCIDAGKKANVSFPEEESRVATNFIR